MTKLSRAWVTAALIVMTVFSQGISAQQFPTKPVRVLAPYSAGSGPDAVMRTLGDKLSKMWGQQLIVDNRPGGNGFIAIGEAKRSAPDGYTLIQVDSTHMALQPHLFKQLPYRPTEDFAPVVPIYSNHFFVVVPANSSWKNMTDLINAAKAKPGEITYGSWGVGSVAHVGATMLEAETGIKMTHVPFKDLASVYTAVANGDINWAFGSAATAGPMYRGNKVKFLALAAPKRLPGFSDVPTVSEAGGPPNFEVKTWVSLFAPKGTPQPVIDRLNADFNKVLAEPDVRERLAVLGFEPVGGSPSQVTKAIHTDHEKYAEIVKRSKISLD